MVSASEHSLIPLHRNIQFAAMADVTQEARIYQRTLVLLCCSHNHDNRLYTSLTPFLWAQILKSPSDRKQNPVCFLIFTYFLYKWSDREGLITDIDWCSANSEHQHLLSSEHARNPVAYRGRFLAGFGFDDVASHHLAIFPFEKFVNHLSCVMLFPLGLKPGLAAKPSQCRQLLSKESIVAIGCPKSRQKSLYDVINSFV